jgi:predicted ATPase
MVTDPTAAGATDPTAAGATDPTAAGLPKAVRTVTVNAAFLQEIKEDNHELRQLLAEVRAALTAPVGTHLPSRQLAELLARLRDQLAMHFALEEAYGYFEEPLTVAPRLGSQAEALRGQHRDLYLEICELVDRAQRRAYHEGNGNSLRSLAADFLGFGDKLQQHEARENELMAQAFDDDIGVGD